MQRVSISVNIQLLILASIPHVSSKVNIHLVIGIGIPVCIALVVSIIAGTMYVRNVRLSRANAERILSIRFNRNDEVLCFMLPTYDEAVKSKPTAPPPSFEESTGMSEG